MKEIKIDLSNYNRLEHFNHFQNNATNTYNITVDIDITLLLTKIKEKKISFYATYLYIITRVVNTIPELRMFINKNNELCYWQSVSPSYTIFHNETKTFSTIWTEYNDNFKIFNSNYLKDKELYKDDLQLYPKTINKENFLSISSLPWLSYSSFEINLTNQHYLLPIITCAKYYSKNNKTILPLSIRAHHSATDGYHVSWFFNQVQELCNNIDDWLI